MNGFAKWLFRQIYAAYLDRGGWMNAAFFGEDQMQKSLAIRGIRRRGNEIL